MIKYKINKRDVSITLSAIFVIISLLGLFFAGSGLQLTYRTHAAGYHNTDLCSNERWIHENINRYLAEYQAGFTYDLHEITLGGNNVTLADCYRQGLSWIQYSFYANTVYSLYIGLFLALLIVSSISLGMSLNARKR